MSRATQRPRGAVSIDLVLCAIQADRLQVLVTKTAGGDSVLPFAWNRPDIVPEQAARQLATALIGRSPAWLTAAPVAAFKRHPAGADLSVPFVAVTGPQAQTVVGAAWHPLDALPVLAPRHKAIAQSALETLMLHMDTAPVAFRLLAPTFTLSDLQRAYELLLGRRLHKASFRRALQAAYLIEPTDEWRGEGRGRPAQLFRYAPRKRRVVHRGVRFDLIGH